MILAVDARLMAGHPRGMGQYARALVSPVRDRVTALLPRSQRTTEWRSRSEGASFFPWWEQWTLPRLSRGAGATHLLCPSNTGPVGRLRGIRKIVVVHDLIFLRSLGELPASRSAYQNLGRLYRRLVVPRAAQSADVLVTVSEFTRTELCERFEIDPRRVHVVPNSIADEWLVDRPLEDAQRHGYVLCVTGEAPSKNVSTLLRAFAELRTRALVPDVHLRLVGIKPSFHPLFLAEARRLGIGDAVTLEGFVSGPELRRMYREAWAFVLPSLFEGFGIPLLEAMASGTPVACGDTTAMPEVTGSVAWQFNPRDVRSMADALTAAITDREGRSRRARAGIERAASFSHSAIARRAMEFWEMIA